MGKLPPAVVVGANLNGLGLARSLRRGGMPVFVLDTSRWFPAMGLVDAGPSSFRATTAP